MSAAPRSSLLEGRGARFAHKEKSELGHSLGTGPGYSTMGYCRTEATVVVPRDRGTGPDCEHQHEQTKTSYELTYT